MRKILATIAIAVLLASAACRDTAAPVPRRTAYPRIALLDTAMRPADSVPAFFLVNAQAATSAKPPQGWLDVAYADYGATLHVTFTRTADIAAVVENRLERLALNSGDRHCHQSEWVNRAGWQILLAETDGSTTPLQFIASDRATIVVSGAVYLADPRAAENTDSIAPVIEALRGDLMRTLGAISLSPTLLRAEK